MITKEPIDKLNFLQNKFFTKSARSAFLHILRKLRDDGKTILIPAYIGMNNYEGSGVFDVIQISRIPYTFYTIDDTLSPELDQIELEKSVDYAFLLIHYFGFPAQNMKDVISFCETNQIVLIEDCAHSIGGTYEDRPLGSFGTFAFHSIHKILATTDGGILVDNTTERNFSIDVNEEGIKTETLALYALSELNKINEKRRQNFNLYLENLNFSKKIAAMHNSLPDGIAPLNFPVFISDGKREQVYFALEEKKISTVALYYRLIPQIDKRDYSSASAISDSILNLPVHQDTKEEDIRVICDTLNTIIDNL